jgi:hypothetical protein
MNIIKYLVSARRKATETSIRNLFTKVFRKSLVRVLRNEEPRGKKCYRVEKWVGPKIPKQNAK